MVDKKFGEKEALKLKKNFNHYLDKTKDIMKYIQFKIEKVFGDLISNYFISPEQITEFNIFLGKII